MSERVSTKHEYISEGGGIRTANRLQPPGPGYVSIREKNKAEGGVKTNRNMKPGGAEVGGVEAISSTPACGGVAVVRVG